MTFPAIDRDAVALFDSPNLTGTPERRLLLAVLERALLDYVGNDSKEVFDAEEWIFDDILDPAGFSPFTFGWVCEQLDLDAVRVLGKIKKMPRRGKNRVAPWYFEKVENNTGGTDRRDTVRIVRKKNKTITRELMRKAS